MKLGFTGTRQGMSQHQKWHLMSFLVRYQEDIEEVHHGCCIGADYEFHLLCRWLGLKVIGHPPSKQDLVPVQVLLDIPEEDLRPVFGYHTRNKHIIEECDTIVGAPLDDKSNSGTWYTINWAQQYGSKKVHVLYR